MLGLGRSKDTSDAEASTVSSVTAERSDGEPTGKGRPTPSRKEAEAARKQALTIPKDPKAAKKAARERDAAARAASRQALLRGDESSLGPRDSGPVKSAVRDYIDSRRTAGELFIPVAVIVLIMSLVPALAQLTFYAWTFMLLLVIVDTTLLCWRMQRTLAKRWPDKEDRKGTTFYAVMRSLQLRRLRLPPPKVRPGGAPVIPKAPKGSKS